MTERIEDAAMKTMDQAVDPLGIMDAALALQQAWLAQPEYLQQRLLTFQEEMVKVIDHACRCAMEVPTQDPVPPVAYDGRFHDPVWTSNPCLDLAKETYLLSSRWLMDTVYETPGMDPRIRHRAAFWTRQMVDAASPDNIYLGNPEAQRRAIETGGRSLLRGMENWRHDALARDIPMQPSNAFRVGADLATTPGRVVHRNRLFELIQYAPATKEVHAVPILFVPPWINKFYILDLNPKRSLIAWLVEHGYTVFTMSWRNPGAEMRDTRFDDYLTEGVSEAVDVVREITGAPQVHGVGYCIGGTLLAAYLAWYEKGRARNRKPPVAHWSAFTTLVDFTDPGEISAFIDEKIIDAIERMMDGPGYLDGEAMAWSFRMLRPNTLIWNYYITRYLLGDEPEPFDVLFWNTDNTRMPQAMHSFYLREFYLNNCLREPDGITLAGKPIDLRRITQPLYNVATEQDHIAPWRSVFRLPEVVSGPVRGVLATSGHILGILSPPVDPPKRRYWAADATGIDDPEAWREQAPKTPGSWWEDWDRWLAERCGPMQKPPSMGSKAHPPLEEAPGVYVHEK